jgi:hypothetical protein
VIVGDGINTVIGVSGVSVITICVAVGDSCGDGSNVGETVSGLFLTPQPARKSVTYIKE